MVAQVSVSTKRQAIANSNRTMFLWVAVMSGVVGVCAVVAIFLGQQIMFRAKVLGELTNTASTLKQNNKVADELAQNILVLETDEGLNSSKASSDEKALQVVLDALPADRNALALGASLQQNILSGIDGLTVDRIAVDGTDSSSLEDTALLTQNTIPIQLQVSATNANALKEMLVKLERSIRTIDIDSIALETVDTGYQMNIQAHAYYEPAKQVQLTDKVVPVR
jgi:hypothetical protein